MKVMEVVMILRREGPLVQMLDESCRGEKDV